MTIFVSSEHHANLALTFVDYIRDFPAFSNQHSILAGEIAHSLYFAYWTAQFQHTIDQTKCALQITGSLGHINSIRIRKNDRRTGLGRALYGCIEKFFIAQGCEKAIIVPSGEGYHFWPRMGFNQTERNYWTKDLQKYK